jgi:hypothetical protein
MRFTKIFGACLITLGIALLVLQVTWMFSGPAKPPAAERKAAHDYKRTPYAGIAGVALIVGGIGFVFTARRPDEPRSRHSMR